MTNPQLDNVPQLLVSVRSPLELTAALEGGADWIDLKEPNQGALSPVTRQAAQAAVEALAARRTLSAALGELSEWEESDARELLSVPGISLVKLGLAGCARVNEWQNRWREIASEAAAHGKQLVTVVYADWEHAQAPSPREVFEFAQGARSSYLLIDTHGKAHGSTFDYISTSALAELLFQARQASMTTVVAGSITPELIGQIPAKLVDIVAVRGAVCRGDRTSQVDAKLVEGFRLALASKSSDVGLPSCSVD